MTRHPIIIAAAIVAMTVLISHAGAAIIVTDGTLHVYASDGRGTSAPPDQPFVSPATWAGASTPIPFGAPGPPLGTTTAATDNVLVSDDGRVDVYTSITWLQGFGSVAIASGNLDITADAAETMQVHIGSNPHVGSGPYDLSYVGRVSLNEVGGGNVFDTGFRTFSNPLIPYYNNFDVLVSLFPGQYTMTWSARGDKGLSYSANGRGGFHLTASVPEPSSALLMILPTATALFRRRRHQRSFTFQN